MKTYGRSRELKPIQALLTFNIEEDIQYNYCLNSTRFKASQLGSIQDSTMLPFSLKRRDLIGWESANGLAAVQ